MEKDRILERCENGRVTARASLAVTGKTHRGKAGLGRPVAGNAAAVAAWKLATGASIAKTAENFSQSVAAGKRYAASEV